MTTAAGVALVVAALLAVLDWVAVARASKPLEYVAKPGATAAMFATVAMFNGPGGAPWILLLVALALCLAGDVFLMLPTDAFVPGLGSFAVAQVMFALSFVVDGIDGTRLAIGLLLVVPAAVFLARRFVGALRRGGKPELVVPVSVYLVVICAMAVSAITGGSAVAIAGAVLFMVSDSLIAESRFVRERRWHPVGIMVTYHLALVGLVLGLL